MRAKSRSSSLSYDGEPGAAEPALCAEQVLQLVDQLSKLRETSPLHKAVEEPQVEWPIGDGSNVKLQELAVLAKGRTLALAKNAMKFLAYGQRIAFLDFFAGNKDSQRVFGRMG